MNRFTLAESMSDEKLIKLVESLNGIADESLDIIEHLIHRIEILEIRVIKLERSHIDRLEKLSERI